MPKLIVFEENARLALRRGADTVADAVKTTLGPRGRNVAIDRRPHAPMVTHDGVTVAKDLELADPFENMGAQLMKAAALRTNEVTGDGTTTATVIAQAIIREGLLNMAAGANPMLMKRGIDRGVEFVVQYLRSLARTVEGREDIARVATVASHDPEIGEMLADILDKVGRDGVVTIEESPGTGISTEFQEGLEIDHGWMSPFFITDEARQEAVVENARVLIVGRVIKTVGEIVPVLERVIAADEKNLFIIADDIEGDALSTLVLTKLRGSLNILATKPPGYGDRRKMELEDIATVTGATVISEESGIQLQDITVKHLGRARRVVSDKDRTTILGDPSTEGAVQARIRDLRSLLAETLADYDREWLQKRLARLSNGIGVIKVGASTQVELQEKKLRVEDALSATRAAIEEGILPGGGVAFLDASAALAELVLPGDQGVGVAILRKALEEPARLLAENAGAHGAVVLDTIRREQARRANLRIGYNVMDGTYVDMIEAGIIDPLKVVRTALENAASVATLILTTEALVAEPPEKPRPASKDGRRRPF
ncbi:MAG TPA: chaperonin GroEL [Chloroflexota bacterium]|nr:chaperonin GroEL [Chloroflexota bacterium]